MLRLPESGFHRSIKTHNVDRETLCDWIEASVLFVDDALSKSDVVDVLLEENVYEEQDFAKELVDDAFALIVRRQRWLVASAALTGDGARLTRNHDWSSLPGHSFCLILALRSHYTAWSDSLAGEYVTQGDLFERFTAEALQKQGWDVHRTGWAGIKEGLTYKSAVTALADALREPAQLDDVDEDIKDQGLDLVCHKAFHDARGGDPVFLIQCASGRNWEKKLRTPSLHSWREAIRFSGSWARGIAMPFTIPDDRRFREFRLAAEGVFWDRYRLLAAGRERRDWISATLRDELLEWMRPAVQSLPTR